MGSLLSKTSLAEYLEKSPHTIEAWLALLENIYSCYRISLYGPPKIKANKKQQKLFLWDWSVIENPRARFENMAASHLLKQSTILDNEQIFQPFTKCMQAKKTMTKLNLISGRNGTLRGMECGTHTMASIFSLLIIFSSES